MVRPLSPCVQVPMRPVCDTHGDNTVLRPFVPDVTLTYFECTVYAQRW